MESIGTEPRTLADDLLVTTAGHDYVNKITDATNATHDFLEAMGAKVATRTSLLFASDKHVRTTLKKILCGSTPTPQSQ